MAPSFFAPPVRLRVPIAPPPSRQLQPWSRSWQQPNQHRPLPLRLRSGGRVGRESPHGNLPPVLKTRGRRKAAADGELPR